MADFKEKENFDNNPGGESSAENAATNRTAPSRPQGDSEEDPSADFYVEVWDEDTAGTTPQPSPTQPTPDTVALSQGSSLQPAHQDNKVTHEPPPQTLLAEKSESTESPSRISAPRDEAAAQSDQPSETPIFALALEQAGGVPPALSGADQPTEASDSVEGRIAEAPAVEPTSIDSTIQASDVPLQASVEPDGTNSAASQAIGAPEDAAEQSQQSGSTVTEPAESQNSEGSQPSTSAATSAEVLFPYGEAVPHLEHEETAEIPSQRRKPRKKRSLIGTLLNLISWAILLIVFTVVIVALIYYRYGSDRLYNTQFVPERTVILNVNPGDRLPQIIERLRNANLLGSYLGVDDAYLLRYLAWLNNNAHKIKSGAYKLNATMSLSEIYNKLVEGSQDFKITIPEGKTAREIAAIVKRKNELFSEERFLSLVEDQTFIRKLNLDVPSLEGYLYPSTYFFGPGMKEEELITMMVETFKKMAQTHLEGIVRTDNLSFHEHVIMASLIEREARIDSERPLIASVIFNRLKKGMRLEIDASVHYAIGDWSRPLSLDDLKTSHPYNTYLNKGLPPGPICNPRIASLVATFQPAQTDYLYYVYKGDGSHAFAKTYEEHLTNIRLYRKGGQSQLGTRVAKGTREPSPNDPLINASELPADFSAESANDAATSGVVPDAESNLAGENSGTASAGENDNKLSKNSKTKNGNTKSRSRR